MTGQGKSDRAAEAVRAARERELNMAAKFLPCTGYEGTLPAVRVAGCLVFAYVEDGRLHVSVDLDDANEPGIWGETVPVQVTVGGTAVWEAP